MINSKYKLKWFLYTFLLFSFNIYQSLSATDSQRKNGSFAFKYYCSCSGHPFLVFLHFSHHTRYTVCVCVCVQLLLFTYFSLNFENLCNFLFFCYVANHQPGKHGNEISGIEMLAIEEELQDSTEDVAVMDYSPVQRKNPIHN